MKTIEVSAAIIEKEDKVLATERGYGEYIGMWEFPGGKLEKGETPETALIREIREEMDAELIIEKFVTTVEYDYKDFHLTMHCFLCRIRDNKYKLLEHSNAKWLSYNELNTVKWLPADIVAIEELLNQK